MRLNVLIAALVMALIFMQYRLWFDSGGIRDMLHLKRMIAIQAVENDKLKKRNEELLFQIERLRNSHDATESRARNELGMIKNGEKFYQIVK
jgi:cell division protein FtsB